MAINHRVMGLVFAFGVGLSLSWCSYSWIADTGRAERRAREEAIVYEERVILERYLAQPGGVLEISDPLNRVRSAGKVFLFPTDSGWEISGHYRRETDGPWHPFLMRLDAEARLVSLSVSDDAPDIAARAAADPLFSVD